ncbi:hypothetical protein NL676_010802 [Syzygium grande]|nr:hypothetical protein NL676_010802 [Syzygium grande]
MAILFIEPLLTGFPNYAFFLIDHFLINISIGYALTIVPIYISKVSPTFFRDSLTSFLEMFINVGTIFGYILNCGFFNLPSTSVGVSCSWWQSPWHHSPSGSTTCQSTRWLIM